MADIEIEIDGKKLTAKPNQTVIQVADEAGIYIPRFCYHKDLSIAANCRMCLVEIEKSPKAVPACATPVMPGMKVFTQSQKTMDAQRAVMEFLLINHPLDCPICDQGGECELQDLAMGYGSSASHYKENKRAVADQDLGPLIATDMTRCIYCTRCVRFGDEVAGLREMGGTFRGECTEIGTYIQHAVRSEISGNIIDLCPVGALTSKPYRFTARPWELDQAPSISPHDCLGSHLNVHSRYGKVMRVVPRENAAINQAWLSDRDRFSYEGLYHADRVAEPMACIDGVWQTIAWEHALKLVAAGLQDTLAKHGADNIGALASPNATLEEFYLLQKIMRGLGSTHIDHRLRERDTRDQAEFPIFPGLQMNLAELAEYEAFLLVGSHIQREQPMASLRIRQAALKGAQISIINAVDHTFHFPVAAKEIVAPHLIPQTLLALKNSLQQDGQTDSALAGVLRGKKVCILLGALALHHPEAARIRRLVQQIATLGGAHVGYLTDGANTAGGWLAGAIPHRQVGGQATHPIGLSSYEMLEKPRQAYVLLNVEADRDCGNAVQAMQALRQADFVVALAIYQTDVLKSYADVILPMAAFAETSGTYVNAMGTWQSFNGAAKAYAASRPAWKILRALGNFLGLAQFEYESSQAIKQEVYALVNQYAASFSPSPEHHHHAEDEDTKHRQPAISRIGDIPIYAGDSLVRRSTPLQKIEHVIEGNTAVVRVHPETAQALNVREGEEITVKQQTAAVKLPLVLDERIAKHAAWIAGGVAATAGLGDLVGAVSLEK